MVPCLEIGHVIIFLPGCWNRLNVPFFRRWKYHRYGLWYVEQLLQRIVLVYRHILVLELLVDVMASLNTSAGPAKLPLGPCTPPVMQSPG